MGAYITYPDTLPRYYDTQKITLDKILQALNNGAGGGGGGGASAGNGAPTGATTGNLYVDELNRDIYVKIGGVWEIALDLV